MSDAPDRDSKTEEATPRKLEQARAKGDAAKTMDLASAGTLAVGASVILVAGNWLARNLVENLTPFFARPDAIELHGAAGMALARHVVLAAAPAVLIIMLATGVIGAAASLLQTGLHVSGEKLKPDLKKISIVKGFERIYGPEGLMQFVKTLVKIVVIGALTWWILAPTIPQFAGLSALAPAAILPFSLEIIKRLVFSIVALTLAIAAIDWLWQRHRFMVRQRMTREEVKEDFKQSDGDPHIKARQRQLRHERSRRRMMQAVPDAAVVVMNPTHYAVALKYEQGQSAAPTCVAKGLDSLALKIRAVAEEAGVPVVEDAPLARALYAVVEIDEMIPPAHYEAVAKIIGFILGQANRRRAAAKPL